MESTWKWRREMGGSTFWLVQRVDDLPPGDSWLSAAESAHAAGLRFDKRRLDWKLGRWTVKRALFSCLEGKSPLSEFAAVEVRSAIPASD